MKSVVSLSLDTEILNSIDKLVKENKRSRSDIVNMLLKESNSEPKCFNMVKIGDNGEISCKALSKMGKCPQCKKEVSE